MRKMIYKIRERNYGGAKFLLHPRPQLDELLSSWLVRIASEQFTAPATFTNLYLREWKNVFWASDLDLQADDQLLEVLEAKSGVPKTALLAMTLRGYEGYLCEQVFTKMGATQFVLPMKMRARRCTSFGLRFCPMCLKEDERPYFRRKWRLTFSTACLHHHCFLHDRCPACHEPLTIYRRQPEGFPRCGFCGFQLEDAKVEGIEGNSYGLKAIERMYNILDNGFVELGGVLVYSHLFFSAIHQLSKVVFLWDKTRGFLDHECMRDKIDGLDWVPKPQELAAIRLKDQYLLFSGLMKLFDDFPKDLLAFCRLNGLGKTELTRDLHYVPFWYTTIVDRFDQAWWPISAEEVANVIEYMRKRGMDVQRKSVTRFLSKRLDYRKRPDIQKLFR